MSYPSRQYACAVLGHCRGQGAAILEEQWFGLGDGRVWNAAARDELSDAARGRRRETVWKNSGNSTAYWEIASCCVDRSALGERQIVIDCDVIQADGGTRCASITGGWVALRLAVDRLMKSGTIISDPILDHVAAVSCGIYAGQPVLDLDYAEDSAAGTDGNFILTGRGRLVEVQMSAEGATFSRGEMLELLDLAEAGTVQLAAAQLAALGRK